MKHKQTASEDIIDFCVQLSRKMIESGANIERVQLANERILGAYDFSDISLYLLSGHVSIGARDRNDIYYSRQTSIPAAGIHLERLKRLNRLSFSVTANKPSPRRLMKMLEEACQTREYKDITILISQTVAMSCLCLIFGGGFREVLTVIPVTAAIHYLFMLMGRFQLAPIVTNAFTMLAATMLVMLAVLTGVTAKAPVILITAKMLLLPGIPLVYAVRNLLCSNEMNGILQTAKVTVETAALVVGIYGALLIFGRHDLLSHTIVTPMTNPVFLLILSFLASMNFGVVFRIPPHDLLRAGVGGLLTRAALLITTPFISNRAAYIFIAALVGALYAEVLAVKRRDPSTYFVYPAIIPLIPGDLLYYSVMGLYIGDRAMAEGNGYNCLLALVGMSVGFVLSSIIAHYVRKLSHLRMKAK